MDLTIAVTGITVLLAVATAIGLARARHARDDAWRRIAEGRNQLNQQRAATREVLEGLCEDCPYRRFFGPF